ncbi:ATP-binding protein [Mycoplasma phocoeninasale]|uniref:ATP-binding protein n=1 Tax=Mycoplasma phocoeninasale TaxID=2726117 RepID=A0A858U3E7_9MOLU|nr:ATP-binding protein [Mycoplasma phocoeninasale]QJG66569.1 ATP-binding protein [Mycoplasma phocoeninasale]
MLEKMEFQIKNQKLELDFDMVNIIVGPKGSGKSTLLSLIGQAIMNKYAFKDGSKWLKEEGVNLDLISVKIDNSTRLAKNFTFYYEKENSKSRDWIVDLQKDLTGYISQDDSRKKSLDESEDVKKITNEKIKEFANKIASTKDNGIEIFVSLGNLLLEYYTLSEKGINFEIIFDKEKSSTKNELSTFINTNNSPEIKNKIESINKNIEDTIKNLNHVENNIRRNNNAIIDIIEKTTFANFFNLDITAKISNYEGKFIEAKNELVEKYNALTKINSDKLKVLEIFWNTYEFQKKEYRKKMSDDKKQDDEWINLLEYFENIATILAKIKKQYDSIMLDEITLNWNQESNSTNLIYKLNPITMDEDEKFEFFKNYLGSDNKRRNLRDLLKNKDKFMKSYDDENLEKKVITPLVENHIEILAGDKRYQDMSLGEKSLFGINYVLNNINIGDYSEYLLLDQIEDNLDNKTITENILPLLMKKKEERKQMFIVTHNSNIGTLLEGKIIVSDIFNEDGNKFISKKIISEDNGIKETGESLYLEGGIKSLNKRSEIISRKINESEEEK